MGEGKDEGHVYYPQNSSNDQWKDAGGRKKEKARHETPKELLQDFPMTKGNQDQETLRFKHRGTAAVDSWGESAARPKKANLVVLVIKRAPRGLGKEK